MDLKLQTLDTKSYWSECVIELSGGNVYEFNFSFLKSVLSYFFKFA